MKEGKKKIIKLKRIFATILAVAMLVTNANIPVLAYDGTDDPPATENNLEGEGLPEVSEGDAAVPEVASDENTESIADDALANENPQGTEKTIVKIEADATNARFDYTVGIDSAVDYAGLGVHIFYSDGTSEWVYDGSTVTENGQEVIYDDASIDWAKEESRYEWITITSGGQSTSYQVLLLVANSDAITGLELSTPPTVQDYLVGSWAIDPYDGMSVKVTYGNGHSETVKSGDSLHNGSYLSWDNNVDFNTVGKYSITVTDAAEKFQTSSEIRVLHEADYVKLFDTLNLGENNGLNLPEGSSKFVFTAPETGEYNIRFHYSSPIDSDVSLKTLNNDYIYNDYCSEGDSLRIFTILEEGKSYFIDITNSQETTADITCEKYKTITKMELLSPPSITQYPVNYDYGSSYEGMQVKVIFEDGDFEELNPFDTLQDGRYIGWSDNIQFDKIDTYQITASYNDISVSADIEVLEHDEYIKTFDPISLDGNSSLNLPEGMKRYGLTASETGEFSIQFHFSSAVTSDAQLKTILGEYTASGNCWEEDTLTINVSLKKGQSYILEINNSQDCNADVTCKKLKTIKEIQFASPPKVTQYPVGYTNGLNYDGTRAKVFYSDNTFEEVGIGESLEDGRSLGLNYYEIDFDKAGIYNFTISYNDISVSSKIEVLETEEYLKLFHQLNKDNNNVSLSKGSNTFIFKVPASTEYRICTKYDTPVSSTVTLSQITGNTIASNTIWQDSEVTVVGSLEKDVFYLINIETDIACNAEVTLDTLNDITAIQLLTLPNTQYYPVGYNNYCDYTGMRVKVFFSNDTVEEIDYYEPLNDGRYLSVTDNVDFNTPGPYQITASYGSCSASIDVSVLEANEYLSLYDQLDLGNFSDRKLQKGSNKFFFTASETGTYDIDFHLSTTVSNFQIGIKEIYSEHLSYNDYGETDHAALTEQLEKDHTYLIDVTTSEACTADIHCSKLASITDIQFVSLPDITEYPVGYSEYLDYSGLRVKVSFDNDTSEETSDSSLSDGRYLSYSDDVDFTKAGTYHFTASYRDIHASTEIKVLEEDEYIKKFDSLILGDNNSIDLPAGTNSFIFTPSETAPYGMVLNYDYTVYSDVELTSLYGNRIDSTSSFATTEMFVTGSLEAGTPYILKVTNSKACNANITIKQLQEITDIEIVSPPKASQYPVNYSDWISYDGMRVKVTFKNGKSVEIDTNNNLPDGRYLSWSDDIDLSKIGTYHITVSTSDQKVSTSTEIQVLSEEDYIKSLPKLSLEKTSFLELPQGNTVYTITAPATGQYRLTTENLIQNSDAAEMGVRTINGENISTDYSHGNDSTACYVTLEKGKTYLLQFSCYSDVYTQFNATKIDDVSRLEILDLPTKLDYPPYFIGDFPNIDFSGLRVQVTYGSGDTEILTNITSVTKDGLSLLTSYATDDTQPGRYLVTVSLGGASDTFNIQTINTNDYLNSLDTLELDKEKTLSFENSSKSITLKYTPKESGEYILTGTPSLTYNSGEINVIPVDGSVATYHESGLMTDIELQAGKTYLFELSSYTTDSITYLLTKAKEISTLEVVSTPKETTFLAEQFFMYDVPLWNGTEIKVTYTDTTTQILNRDQKDISGRRLDMTASFILWEEPGTYPVFIHLGKKTTSFNVNIVDGDKYFQNAETFTLPAVKGNVESGSVKNYSFIPQENGTYIFTLNSAIATGFPLTISVYDDTYSRLNVFSHEMANTYYTQLEKGVKYYLQINNRLGTTDTAFDLSAKKDQISTVTSIKLKQNPTNATRVAGADFTRYFPYGEIVEATYGDGTTKILDPYDYSIYPVYNPFRVGTYRQAINYMDQTAYFDINVIAPKDYLDTVPLTLNKFTELDNTYQGNNPIYLYSFTPNESKDYYINADYFNMGLNTNYFRLLSGDGEILDIHNSIDPTWQVSLNKNQKYYIALYSSNLSSSNVRISITEHDVTVSAESTLFTYTGDEIKAPLTVTLDGKILTPKTDYVVSYQQNINAGIAYADVTPAGNQNFVPTRFFYTIASRDLYEATIEDVPDQLYTGKEVEPKVLVTYNGKTLKEGTDYNLGYQDNVEIGTAKVIIRGMWNFHNIITKEFEIKQASTITYELNGGTNNPGNPEAYDSVDVTLKDPSRKGYSFAGWYTDKDLKTKITTIKGGTNKNYTLYAKWTKISVGKVSGLTVTSSSTSSVNVKWTAVKGADGYVVEYSENKLFKPFDTLDVTTTSASITGLPAGSTRYVRLYAYVLDSAGERVTSSENADSLTIKAKPAAPEITKITGGDKQITLTWKDVDGEEGYQVYISTSKTGTYTKASTLLANQTSAKVTGLKTATTYYLKVRAYTTSGGTTQYSSFGSIKYGTTAAAVPTIKTVTGGQGKAVVSWESVPGASGYVIYMATSASGTYENIGFVRGNTLTFTKTGLSAAKNYYFRVRSYRVGQGVNVYSNYSSYKYCGTATSTPAFSTVTGSTQKISLNWKDVSGESGYQIYMATSANGNYTRMASLKANTTSYTLTKLSTAKTYYVKIRSYRTVNNQTLYSSFSKIITTTTATATPAISSVTGGINKAVISWKAVTGASGYAVYMSSSANGTYQNIGTVKSGTLSLTKTGLSSAKIYYFKVRAYRSAGGKNTYSNYSSYQYCGTATVAPSISSITAGAQKATLRWKDVSGENYYQIYMATSASGSYSRAATLKANTTSYTKTGLTKGKTYYFKIRTYRTVNGKTIYSSFSSVKSIKVK